MTFGQSIRAPAGHAAGEAAVTRGSTAWKAWHRLGADDRIELIESALKAANDRIDAYPLAL